MNLKKLSQAIYDFAKSCNLTVNNDEIKITKENNDKLNQEKSVNDPSKYFEKGAQFMVVSSSIYNLHNVFGGIYFSMILTTKDTLDRTMAIVVGQDELIETLSEITQLRYAIYHGFPSLKNKNANVVVMPMADPNWLLVIGYVDVIKYNHIISNGESLYTKYGTTSTDILCDMFKAAPIGNRTAINELIEQGIRLASHTPNHIYTIDELEHVGPTICMNVLQSIYDIEKLIIGSRVKNLCGKNHVVDIPYVKIDDRRISKFFRKYKELLSAQKEEMAGVCKMDALKYVYHIGVLGEDD